MNKQELKDSFLQGNTSLLELWSELETIVLGTDDYKQFVSQNNIQGFSSFKKNADLVKDTTIAYDNYLEDKCTLINYSENNTPQDFDGGILQFLGVPFRRRFVFLEDNWYSFCENNGVLLLDDILKNHWVHLQSVIGNRSSKDLIKSCWRMKGV